MQKEFGFVKLAVCSPETAVGNVAKNVAAIRKMLTDISADIYLFPELCITGYTCGDLFGQTALIHEARMAIEDLAPHTSNRLVVVGLPLDHNGRLYNCAAVLGGGGVILGIVPKVFLPNYKEFYEKRWFTSGKDTSSTRWLRTSRSQSEVPFGTDILFKTSADVTVGVEICEDLWMPIPPSCHQAIAGANILLNLSASNETVGKCEYRRDLVKNQSGRCVAAYAYASSGPSESTSDLVFGGHCMVAENGSILVESERVGKGNPLGSHHIITDLDIDRLCHERQAATSFGETEAKPFRSVYFSLPQNDDYKLDRKVSGRPFVPSDPNTLHDRCEEIFGIQVSALAKRMSRLSPISNLNIGISGGLDSTLALLVAVKACDMIGWDRRRIFGITMPGFGTTEKTKTNAIKLMDALKISQKTIDIRPMCIQMFNDMGHKPFGMVADGPITAELLETFLQELAPGKQDLVFENVQARVRTLVLMSHGFVLGTGDLSELALGWCTYNGDHMSMYNVNCSIPKTLVKFLVDYVAENEFYQKGKDDPEYKIYMTLKDIVATTISPELLPHKDGEIVQSTEDVLGPYELHDFFLSCFVRNGFSPEKIFFLAKQAEFSKKYDEELIRKTLIMFYRRFFANQFKRNCVPDGPKVGSCSLSPRGDWRMPSDADVDMWVEWLETQKVVA